MSELCYACPRRCGAARGENSPAGVCASPSLPVVVRAAPHFGEEPCISGPRGSGAVFFSGCSLRCVFCQNREISRSTARGRTVTAEELRDILLSLQEQGVHNINLVTPTHFTLAIRRALELAKLTVPVVWNSSGYESVDTLKTLEGLVQVYMPDYKYALSEPARRYSGAEDYPSVALAAIREMFRQRGNYELDGEGLLRSGVLIRHLMLPGQTENTMEVIDRVAESFPRGSVLFSLMSQYTPMGELPRFPELSERIDPATNEHMIRYMLRCGITEGYTQEVIAATEEMIPAFDGTGVERGR